MSWVAVWAVAAAVGVDGWFGSVALGLRRMQPGPMALACVSLAAGLWAGLAMAAGHALAHLVPAATARWASAALLFAAGVTMLYDAFLAWRQEKADRIADTGEEPPPGDEADGPLAPAETLLLGCVVASGAAAAAFAVGLAGRSSPLVPAAIGLAGLLPGGPGSRAAAKGLAGWLLAPCAFLPGGVLMLLGLLRFW